MGQSSSFPFEIGEVVPQHPSAYWQLHVGKRKSDGTPVSIFKLDKLTTPRLKMEAGMHGLQKMKSLRHPYILQYLEGADLEKELVLVTEPVKPLKTWLSTVKGEFKEEQVAWGLRCLASALDFLNSSHHMTHGMICSSNIFVTRSGDWKLGGLDILCEWKRDGKDILHFQVHESIVAPEYRAPERRNGNIDLMLKGAPGSLDMWALGVVIGEIASTTTTSAGTTALKSIQRRLMAENFQDRPSASQLLRHSYLSPSNKELIQVLLFLETFSLKDEKEKLQFFQNLASNINRLPPEIGAYKILPTFRDYVCIDTLNVSGAIDSAALNHAASQRQLLLGALPVCLEILKTLDQESFSLHGESLLVFLFGLNDRSLRAMLLTNLQPLAEKMSEENINGKVFDSIQFGFTDSAPQLRELTLKSMLALSPRLNERNLNDRLMRSLAKLQSDPEPSIRTNTTIFFGRIAPQLKEGARVRILLPTFLKACRDPFPHARLAGLRAAAACSAYFDVISISTKLLPTICMLLIDGDGAVREGAFQAHETFMKILHRHAQGLKEKEEEEQKKKVGLVDKDHSEEAVDGLGGSASSRLGSSLAQATSSVAAWGAQKVWSSSSLLASSSTSHPSKPTVMDESVSVAAEEKHIKTQPSGGDDFFNDILGSSSSEGREETASISVSSALDGWNSDDEDGAGDAWKDDEMDLELDEKPKPLLPSSSSSSGTKALGTLESGRTTTSSLSSSINGLKLGSAAGGSNNNNNTASSSIKSMIRPVTDDDLFSMLNDAPTSRPKASLVLPSNSGINADAAKPSSSSAARISVRASRLQAKKMTPSSDDNWDDF